MKIDRSIEDDGAIKITMRQGHLKLVGGEQLAPGGREGSADEASI